MAYIDDHGRVVPTTEYERDLDASFRRPGPHCPWCGFHMDDHEGSSVEECAEAVASLCEVHE